MCHQELWPWPRRCPCPASAVSSHWGRAAHSSPFSDESLAFSVTTTFPPFCVPAPRLLPERSPQLVRSTQGAEKGKGPQNTKQRGTGFCTDCAENGKEKKSQGNGGKKQTENQSLLAPGVNEHVFISGHRMLQKR